MSRNPVVAQFLAAISEDGTSVLPGEPGLNHKGERTNPVEENEARIIYQAPDLKSENGRFALHTCSRLPEETMEAQDQGEESKNPRSGILLEEQDEFVIQNIKDVNQFWKH